MALLPSRDTDGTENVFALVWTVKSAERDEVLRLDDAAFLAQLQQRIGERAGHFVKVGERAVYPLGWMQSREHVRQRLAIIGNAAHTLHPVAGQGFNLGLRDVAVLAQVVLDGVKRGRDPGELELLREYAKWRRRDQLETALFTDGLVRTFSTAFPPIVLARNIGLTLVDILPPVKHVLARHAMGLGGKLPRLARGLRL
jgi:2-octaprenyl-6-methoxyphenol hydroxylase